MQRPGARSITRLDSFDVTALSDLFANVFAASEGAQEGALIGDFVRQMLFSSAHDLRVFAATEQSTTGERISGCAIFSRMRYDQDPRVVFILSPMAVETSMQGQGLGQQILREAINQLRTEGVDAILTYGDPAYYGKVGFTPVTEEDAPAPMPLSMPQGWLAQSLAADRLVPLCGKAHCVKALNNPDLW